MVLLICLPLLCFAAAFCAFAPGAINGSCRHAFLSMTREWMFLEVMAGWMRAFMQFVPASAREATWILLMLDIIAAYSTTCEQARR